MNLDSIVYFAELNTDNSISKIIQMSASLSLDTANSFSPSAGATKCKN